MATQLLITDGISTVNLLDPAGFAVRYGEWAAGHAQPTVEEVVAAIGSGGGRVSNVLTGNVTENMRLILHATSHDNAATSLQALESLLEQAFEFQEDEDMVDPVYLVHQTENETNPRYSKVIWGTLKYRKNFHHLEFVHNDVVDGIQLQLRREPYWRSSPPGVLPSQLLGVTSRNGPDHSTAFESIVGTAPRISTLDALDEGRVYGMSWDLSLGVNPLDHIKFIDIVNNEKRCILEFMLDIDDWSNSTNTDNNITMFEFRSSGPNGGSFRCEIGLVHATQVFRFHMYTRLDNGSETLFVYNHPWGLGPVRWAIEWQAATAPGANDGLTRLREGGAGGTDRGNQTGLDNDLHDITEIWIGNIWLGHANNLGRMKVDTVRWSRDTFGITNPEWEQAIDLDNVLHQPITNHYHASRALTHIYNYDASLTAFSPNLILETHFKLFEVNHNPVVTGDYVYFGSTQGEWYGLYLYLVSTGTGGAGFTTQYWDGAAWTTFTLLIGNLDNLDNGYTGPLHIHWSGASDWAQQTINGVAAHWIRLRVAVTGSLSPAPAQGGQTIITPESDYLEVPADQIGGDLNALGIMRINSGGAHFLDGITAIGLLAAGVKSRGLTNFRSRLNCGGENIAGWTESYEVDTTKTTDPESAAGDNATCTFATIITERERFYIEVNDVDIESDYEGRYQVYLRCQQIGGSVNDVEVRLYTLYAGDKVAGEMQQLQFVDAGPELVDMGSFQIKPSSVKDGEAATAEGLRFEVQARSASSTPNLEMYELALIPTDELFMGARRPLLEYQLDHDEGLQIDAGVLRKPSVQKMGFAPTYRAIVPWEMTGAPPELPSKKLFRIFFLFGYVKNDEVSEWAKLGHTATVQLYAVEQFRSLRGAS